MLSRERLEEIVEDNAGGSRRVIASSHLEALDEIDRLQKEVERLSAGLDAWCDNFLAEYE